MMKRSHKKVIHLIAAARPNFMKIAPLYHALSKVRWAQPVIVHTGQHYDIKRNGRLRFGKAPIVFAIAKTWKIM
jgi:UDP-N-acetylglucosamine 2-epimerase